METTLRQQVETDMTSWAEWHRSRDTLVPHDHTQRVPGCFRCDLSSLEVPNA